MGTREPGGVLQPRLVVLALSQGGESVRVSSTRKPALLRVISADARRPGTTPVAVSCASKSALAVCVGHDHGPEHDRDGRGRREPRKQPPPRARRGGAERDHGGRRRRRREHDLVFEVGASARPTSTDRRAGRRGARGRRLVGIEGHADDARRSIAWRPRRSGGRSSHRLLQVTQQFRQLSVGAVRSDFTVPNAMPSFPRSRCASCLRDVACARWSIRRMGSSSIARRTCQTAST